MYKYVLIVTFILLCIKVDGQFLNNQNVIPPTPDVASFAKNIDIPMTLSSGVPGINIPIASVESGTAQISVSLSYNASGIRVEETPTWVGLGFNLNAGGTITRVVRGLPDEGVYGYINSAANRKVKYVRTLPNNSSERLYIELQLIPDHQIDLEPDIFNFSIMGYSGQFYWDQDSSKFILSPYQNVKLEITGTLGIFKMTLPNGIVCFFGENQTSIEQINSSGTSSRIDGQSYDTEVVDNTAPYNTCWHINRILSPAGKQIEFQYTREEITEYGRGGETESFNVENHSTTVKTATFFKRIILQPVLTSITGENCKVNFVRSLAIRSDVVQGGTRKSLESIVIEDKNGIEIKNFQFNYDYFQSITNPLLWGIAIPFESVAGIRLYLKSVKEGNGQKFHAPYEFTYNSPLLPDRTSADQDYWGYYNGKGNPMNGILSLMPRRLLIPGFGLPGWPYELPTTISDGANRNVDINYAKAGSLKTIKYPTGGTVEFTYESNDVQNSYYNPESGLVPSDYMEKIFTFMPLVPANPPYPGSYLDSFQVNKPLTKIKITPNLPSPCSEVSSQSCRYTITIKSKSDINFPQLIFNTTPVFYVALPKGKYTIEASVTGDMYDMPNFTVKLNWGENEDSVNMKTGGLRIQKTVFNDGLGNLIQKTYQYKFPNSNYSSGILAGLPTNVIIKNDILGNYSGIDNIISNGFIPLTTDGQTIRYQFVTELAISATSNLKTEYWFNYDFAGVTLGKLIRGEPQILRSWHNNELIRKTTFSQSQTGYNPLTDEWHGYQFSDPIEKIVGLHGLRLVPYSIASEWYYPVSDSIVQYTQSGTAHLNKAEKYFYNNLHLINRKRSTSSNGSVIEEKTLYPSDYNNNVDFNIQSLQTNFNIALPIKREFSNNGKITNGIITKYNQYGKPIEYYKYEGTPLADTVLHNRNLILETGYKSNQVISYVDENPVQILGSGNMASSYIWGYGQLYPIASIQNATVSQCAYTSFESSDTKGNWSYTGSLSSAQGVITGRSVYNLGSGSITKGSLLSSVKYQISYWQKTGGTFTVTGAFSSDQFTGKTLNGYTYHSLIITGGSSISILGSGYIDELRIYPLDAQMVTYTFDRLVGMTSQCDINNRMTYYEYDVLGRLSLIRDENKNILKKFCYNYAGQPEDCAGGPIVYSNETKSQTFTRNNCTAGMTGTTVTYSVPAGTYFSYVDVATANNLALNDISLNGQNYANTNGSCTAPSCPSPSKRLINGVCTRGLIIYTASIYEPSSGQYSCVYHYEFPDGYHSEDLLKLSPTSCL